MLSQRVLDAAVERAVARLADLGIRAGARVAVIMADPLDVTVAVLGLHRVGAVGAVIDARLSRRRTLDLLQRVEPDAVLAEPLGSVAEEVGRIGLG
jgi:acyl-coenzyme A synthetase/AMP-(fatty) acid ligase